MNDISAYFKHAKTVLKHRHIVMKLCFKCGYFKRGLLHDLSKFSPTEFVSSARYFQGHRSPIEAEKESIGYSIAWQHHKGHNPHHWEYWIDNVGTYKNTPIEMPFEYVVEMVCDWISASIVYSGNECDFEKPFSEPMVYYAAHQHERIFHKDTKVLIENMLSVISDFGVKYFCTNVKKIGEIAFSFKKLDEEENACK